MPANMIAELAKAIAPPEKPLDWNEEAVKRNSRIMGTTFPDDFIEFGKIYGSGRFKTAYSWEVWSPARKTYPLIVLDFSRSTFAYKEAMKVTEVPFGIYPEIGGFLPFASTPNGDHVGWVTKGSDPNAWKVVDFHVYEPKMYQELDMGFSEYFYNVLSRKTVLDRHKSSNSTWTLADVKFNQQAYAGNAFEIE